MNASPIADQLEKRGVVVLRNALPEHVVSSTRDFLIATVARRYKSDYQPLHTDNPVAGLKDATFTVPIAKVLKILGVLDALLGPTSFLRLPPGVRAVHPNHAGGLGPAHQDGGRLSDMDHFVTVWVPFVKIDQACGGLGFYTSLGHAGPIPEGANGIDVGAAVPTPIYMSPGDVLIFHKWMTHVSMPNTSDRIRYSMDMRFYSSLKRMEKEALDCQEWKVVYPPQ